MLFKNDVKLIKLLGQKKARDASGLFIAEGEKLVLELIHAGLNAKAIYITNKLVNNILVLHNEVKVIEAYQMESISALKNVPSCLAVFYKPEATPIVAIVNNWTLALDNLQDPGNVGTIVRIADWFGIKNIVCNNQTADVFNAKAIQATMGSIARVNIGYENLESWLQLNNQVPIYATSLKGENLIESPKLQPGILVIGNEGQGVSASVMEIANKKIMLPCLGAAESLNAAVATAVILGKLLY